MRHTTPPTPRKSSPFFAPFDRQIAELTRGRRQFALLSSPVFAAAILDEHLRLLDMRPFLAGKASEPPAKKSGGEVPPGTF
ncbi:MAG: hypothetical protein NTY36_09905 [Deltaproteobacteria bacterium]|nr:hypothetical protein [Deltaproteobacteria bacterium]